MKTYLNVISFLVVTTITTAQEFKTPVDYLDYIAKKQLLFPELPGDIQLQWLIPKMHAESMQPENH